MAKQLLGKEVNEALVANLLERTAALRAKGVNPTLGIIRLGENHTLLSIQSTEGRKGTNERFANMQVYVGDKNARNFCNRSTPMPELKENASALWNSLHQIDDETVIAIMSVGGQERGKGGIWTVKGKIAEIQ